MKKRQLTIVFGILLIVGGVTAMRAIASLKAPSERKAPGKTARSVEFVRVVNDSLSGLISITGKIVAKDKVELFAEVNGNLSATSSNFKEGNNFRRGDALLTIDDSELRLNIQSQKSNLLSTLTRILPDLKLDYPDVFDSWKKYTDDFDLTASLQKLPEAEGREKYFLSTQGVFNQYYAIKSQEARLSKYIIRAPFSGTVSQSLINPGTLVRAGQKLGEFISTNIFELEAAVDIEQLKFINIGAPVNLYSSQLDEKFKGEIVRISDAIDAATQSAKVIIEVKGQVLKEGMYLNGSIESQPFADVFAANNNQITKDGQVFLIEDGLLKARSAKIVFTGNDKILVQNLPNKAKLLKAIYTGAKDGAPVKTKAESDKSPKQ